MCRINPMTSTSAFGMVIFESGGDCSIGDRFLRTFSIDQPALTQRIDMHEI